MLEGKGVLNNRISEFVMMQPERIGVPTTSSSVSTCASS
jgi:phosphoribosylaminoimidazole-succinocarboxamide synthase